MTDKFVQELQELFRFSVATRCRMLQAATGCAKLNLSHIREVTWLHGIKCDTEFHFWIFSRVLNFRQRYVYTSASTYQRQKS